MRFLIEKYTKKAYNAGGYRERYAMQHGAPRAVIINGNKCIIWYYAPSDPYQDANGATFDTVRGVWIN